MHDAFISYSRRNADFARRLEKALEEFKPPRDLAVPQRYLNVFRDETDFTGVEYFQSVEHHLGDSSKLILVCSPQARASTYVGDEVRRFAQKHGAENIIPILLDGIPNNEATPEQSSDCAFPEALCEVLGMPLAISYRGFDPKKDRVDKGAFADSWFALLANLYGISRADVERREKRRQQRNRRILVGIVTGIITSLAIALVVSLLFWRQSEVQRGKAETAFFNERKAKEAESKARLEEEVQRKFAEEKRKEAVREFERAERERAAAVREAIAARSETSGRLAVQALEKVDGAPDDALELAVAAVNTFHSRGDPITPRAIGALQRISLAFAGSRPALPWRKDRAPVVVDGMLQWAAASETDGAIVFGAAGTSSPRTLSPPSGVLQRGERWARAPSHLAFAGDRLVAMRGIVKSGKPNEIKHGALWFWRIGKNGIDAQPVIAGRFDVSSWGSIRSLPSPDGRWLLWEVGWDKTFLQRLDPPGKLMPVCDNGCEPRAFTDDGRKLLFYSAGKIHRFAIGESEATALPVIETEIYVANMAVLAREERMRLAVLGHGGGAEWWDIDGSSVQQHALPNVFPPFEKDLEVVSLGNTSVRTSLAWDSEGEALLATVAEEGKQEFGIAAVHDLKGEAWQPVQHRYELKATETMAQLSGDGGGVTGGYRVKNAGNLGTASAMFFATDVLSLGFDGTVLYRRVDEGKVNEKFKLIETGASFVTFMTDDIVVAGKRDGKVQFVDSDNERWRSAPFNGHGAPVTALRWTMDWNTRLPARLLSTDSTGFTRVWDLSAPGAFPTNDDVRVTSDWKWLAVDEDEGTRFWPLALPEPLWSPRNHPAFAKATVAWNEDASQAATVHVEPKARLPIVVRLWTMRGDRLPRVPVAERRFAGPKSDGTYIAARLADSGLLLSDGDQVWMTDLRQQQPLRNIGGPGVKLHGASDDLRWLVVERAKQAFLVDTRQPRLMPLGATVRVESVREWSADGRWLVIRGEHDHYFVDLTAATPKALAAGNVRDVLLGTARPPLIHEYGDDHTLRMWQPSGRFAKVAANAKTLAWDQSGRWVAIGHDAGRVWLTQPAAGATPAQLGAQLRSAMKQRPLPQPAEVEARGDIEELFPFPEQGWVLATVDRHLIVWHRGISGAWEQPTVFTKAELRQEHIRDVRLRADGRMALVGTQILSLDPEYLMTYSKRLAK